MNGFARVAAQPIVARKFAAAIFEPIREQGFDRCADPIVQLLAPFDQYRVVRDLLGERVLEDELRVAHRWLLVDELAQLQVIKQGAEFVVSFRQDRSNQRQRKYPPDN